jgi:biotin carboxyl carrier protein
MKLTAAILGYEHAISLDLMDSTVAAEVDGRRYDIELRRLACGEYLLVSGANVYKCRVEQKRDSPAGEFFQIVLRGHSYYLSLIDPKRLRSGQSSATHHTGAAEIVSPMPGKIVRVLVTEGATVEAGAGVIVVEAMKMQNEMKAPKAGLVISINAQEGATVNAGDVLAVIE